MVKRDTPQTVLDGLCVARGLHTALSSVNKFGKNAAVGTTEEDIWDAGGVWAPWTSGAQAARAVSTSASDDGDFVIEGPDGVTGLWTSETMTLNGTSQVTSTKTFRHGIFRAYMVDAAAVGNITITGATDTEETVAQVLAGVNQTLMAVYSVPSNHNAYICAWYAGLLGNNNVNMDVTLYQRGQNADFWKPVQALGCQGGGTSRFYDQMKVPIKITGGSLLKVGAAASTGTQSAFAGFDLVLENVA